MSEPLPADKPWSFNPIVIKIIDWAGVFPDEVGHFKRIPVCPKLTNAQVEYIWKSKWSLIKALYLLSRFGPYFDTLLSISCTPAIQESLSLVPDLPASVPRSRYPV